MRTIKFKGKESHTKKWIYGDLLTSPNGVICYIVEKKSANEYYLKNEEPVEVDTETVGQYSEFNDKNGEEIYHRDTVKWKNCKFLIDWNHNNGCWYGLPLRGNETKGILSAYLFRESIKTKEER